MHYDYSRGSTSSIIGRKRHFRLPRPLLIVILLVGGFFIIRSWFFRDPPGIASPLVDSTQGSTLTNGGSKDDVISSIRNTISNKPGSYSVYVVNLANEDSMGINENMIFTAASVNKIPILAVLYHLADKGEIDLDQTIRLQSRDVQDFGTGTIRYDPIGSIYSLKTLARLMVEKSDNTAGYILGEQIIGFDKVQEQINEWGLNQTDMKMNKTSNSDMYKLFRLIFDGKIANSALTAEMIDFMDDSDYEDRIPAQLPKDVTIYHKIGNEIRIIHDVGIVDLGNNKSYYIGVMITDNPSDEDAVSVIAAISKIIYDYFTRGTT